MYPLRPQQTQPPPPPRPSTAPTPLDPTTVADFHAALLGARRTIAVLGAGLSAASGIPTYRSRTGSALWRNHDIAAVATPAALRRDPGLVWEFYASRRRQALGADPNAAHWALAELARRRQFSGSGVRRSERGCEGTKKGGKSEGEGQGGKREEEEEEEEDGAKGEEKEEGEKTFLALTQNIDGLSIRAGHPPDGIWNLHGSLFDLKCTDAVGCGYRERDNFAEPLTPALAKTDGEENDDDPDPDRSRIPKASSLLLDGIAAKNRAILGEGRYVDAAPKATDYQALQPPTTDTTGDDGKGKTPLRPKAAVLDIPLPSKLTAEELPRCPKCKTNLLRPDVVWFGETLSVDVVEDVDALFARGVDLCLVVGTSSTVWPVAGYADRARAAGARVAVVNTDPGDAKNMRPGDWVFVGGAAEVLPVLLEPVIGLREGSEGEEGARGRE